MTPEDRRILEILNKEMQDAHLRGKMYAYKHAINLLEKEVRTDGIDNVIYLLREALQQTKFIYNTHYGSFHVSEAAARQKEVEENDDQ